MKKITESPFFGMKVEEFSDKQASCFFELLLPIEQDLALGSAAIIGRMGFTISTNINNRVKAELLVQKKSLLELLRGTSMGASPQGKRTLLTDFSMLGLHAKWMRVDLNSAYPHESDPAACLHDSLLEVLSDNTETQAVCMILLSEIIMAKILPMKRVILKRLGVGEKLLDDSCPPDWFIQEPSQGSNWFRNGSNGYL